MNRGERAAIGVVALLLVAGFSTASLFADEPDSAFHGTTPVPSDGRDVRRLATGPLALQNEPAFQDAAVVVLAADTPYTKAELDAFDAYVRGGGTVVVLDIHGYGTRLTARHGITFERVRLSEPAGSVAVDAGGTHLLISTWNASALLVDDPQTVLAWSSPESHLDRDGNGTIDAADPNGPFPVVARVRVGEGSIWAIAAPAAFDPDVDQLLDESAFRNHVLGTAKVLLVDEGHVASDDPSLLAARALWTLAADPWRWLVLAVVGLGVTATFLPSLVPGLRQHRFDPRALIRRDSILQDDRPRAPSGFTERGRIALAATVAFMILGLAFASPQAAWAGTALLVPLVSAYFLGPPNATAVRTVSSRRVGEGTPVRVDLRIQFRGNRAGVTVQDELPDFFESNGSALVHPRRRVEERTYTVRPARLGRYHIGPLHAERSDPLGLRVQVSTVLGPTEIRVTPRLEGTRDSPFRTKVPQIVSGGHQVNRAGGGTEFLALREYQTGDTMRMVNWKASARAKNLMVNQRVHETPMILTLLVDARAVSDWGPADSTPFVRAARSAASIAQETIAGRDRCRIFLYGDGVHRVEGRGADLLHRFQEHMADTRATGAMRLADVVSEVQADVRNGQPVVFVGGGEEDEGLEDALELLRRRGSRIHVVMPIREDLGDPDTRRASIEQRALSARLRARGFNVYELEPDRRLEDSWHIMGGSA